MGADYPKKKFHRRIRVKRRPIHRLAWSNMDETSFRKTIGVTRLRVIVQVIVLGGYQKNHCFFT